MIFGKKVKTKDDEESAEPADLLSVANLEKQAEGYMKQARATLLEANISGTNVKDAQELFKKALHEQRGGHYDKAIEHALECIELVDNILKNS